MRVPYPLTPPSRTFTIEVKFYSEGDVENCYVLSSE